MFKNKVRLQEGGGGNIKKKSFIASPAALLTILLTSSMGVTWSDKVGRRKFKGTTPVATVCWDNKAQDKRPVAHTYFKIR